MGWGREGDEGPQVSWHPPSPSPPRHLETQHHQAGSDVWQARQRSSPIPWCNTEGQNGVETSCLSVDTPSLPNLWNSGLKLFQACYVLCHTSVCNYFLTHSEGNTVAVIKVCIVYTDTLTLPLTVLYHLYKGWGSVREQLYSSSVVLKHAPHTTLLAAHLTRCIRHVQWRWRWR